MKKIRIFILLLFFGCRAFAQQGQGIYTSSNEIFIELVAHDRLFEYLSPEFFSRLDKDESQFKFVLPLTTVTPREDLAEMAIFEAIFPPESQPLLYLTADFPKNTFSLMEYNSTEQLQLEGVLSINERSVPIPVNMSLFYKNNILYYNISFDFDLASLEIPVPDDYGTMLTGTVKMYVNEGMWADFLRD